MAAAMTLALTASACVQPAVKAAGPVAAAPLLVGGFQNFEGGLARKSGQADCAAQGKVLRTSIYDRYTAGNWVFVEGCR